MQDWGRGRVPGKAGAVLLFDLGDGYECSPYGNMMLYTCFMWFSILVVSFTT